MGSKFFQFLVFKIKYYVKIILLCQNEWMLTIIKLLIMVHDHA